MVQVGDIAPDFSTKDSAGNPVHLTDFRGKQRVVLYFFPKCFTPGCDIEAQKFRDDYPKFQGKSTVILGVSADDAEAAEKFRAHFHLQFSMLPDPEKKLIGLYGVGGMLGYAKRTTFLIGLDGKVEEVVDARLPAPHVEKTLEKIQGSG